jgi:hypothetical protein
VGDGGPLAGGEVATDEVHRDHPLDWRAVAVPLDESRLSPGDPAGCQAVLAVEHSTVEEHDRLDQPPVLDVCRRFIEGGTGPGDRAGGAIRQDRPGAAGAGDVAKKSIGI